MPLEINSRKGNFLVSKSFYLPNLKRKLNLEKENCNFKNCHLYHNSRIINTDILVNTLLQFSVKIFYSVTTTQEQFYKINNEPLHPYHSRSPQKGWKNTLWEGSFCPKADPELHPQNLMWSPIFTRSDPYVKTQK